MNFPHLLALTKRCSDLLAEACCIILPRIRFHDLRHTFATMALQNGVDVKTVSSMLGHYSAGFTLDTYAHVLAPGAHSQFGSGKNSQFKPER